jgi:hypothetical protein
MDPTRLRVCLIALLTNLLLAVVSCSGEQNNTNYAEVESGDTNNEGVWKMEDGPFIINNDTTVATDVIIEAGTLILINDSAELCFEGNVHFAGTSEKRVKVAPINNHCGYITFDGDKAHVKIEESIFVNSKLKFNQFVNATLNVVRILNTAKLQSNESLICAYRGGNLSAKEIKMISNDWGEGIVVTKMDTVIITDSYFENINDAVEIEMCSYGQIRNCQFIHNKTDDAIDLNGCDTVYIENNRFTGIADNAIEAGWNLYYKRKTHKVYITNNLFETCKIGIQAKESAHIVGDHNTYQNCKYITCSVHENSFQQHRNSIVDNVLVRTDSIGQNATRTRWEYSATNSNELFGTKNCLLHDLKASATIDCFGESTIGYRENSVNKPLQ